MKNNGSNPIPPKTKQDFPIVGIGASAGGLQAFKRFLKAIPVDSGMAYVLVQHLDPRHNSMLPDLLAKVATLPVHEITDDIHLAPNHIYVIPPNKMLTATDGVLKIHPRDLTDKRNLPIDLFFRSLAEVHTSFAVGVVLSGTATDGTLGLKAIKEHGGVTFAQDRESADFDGMPQSAISAEVVDFIMPPEKIPQQLLLIDRTYKNSHAHEEERELENEDDAAVYKQIITLLRLRSGIDFSHYKQATIRRRMARRMALHNTEHLSDYVNVLRGDKVEQDALFNDVLIPVTYFFRDARTFEALKELVYPALLINKSGNDSIRVWVAGCSTGEEAYSLAISLHEFFGDATGGFTGKIQVFATDLSEACIAKARLGLYTKADVQTVSEERLEKFFVKTNGNFQVIKRIREMCVFAVHNFIKDPPFSKLDFISCRNALIYMDEYLHEKAYTTFNYALGENGFLLLGKSESTSSSPHLFTPVSKTEKIYANKPLANRSLYMAHALKDESVSSHVEILIKPNIKQTDFQKSADDILSKYAPAGVVLNTVWDIVQFRGDTSRFLTSPPGKPSTNLMVMAREGLAFELRSALEKAKASEDVVMSGNIPIKNNTSSGSVQDLVELSVNIEVIPITKTEQPYYLVLFHPLETKPIIKESKSSKGKTHPAEERVSQLEKELAQVRDDMHRITQDQEAVNEELQSANEELTSSSEELQSLNEELETSSEELQSTNEELVIINQELIDREEQLTAARVYADAILATAREPMILMDKDLVIKNVNATFCKKFKLVEHDIEEKYFYDIQNHAWDNPQLRNLLLKVLPQKTVVADFEVTQSFPVIGERIFLINALQVVNEKTVTQLILLSLEDVTERRYVEVQLKGSEARFRQLADDLPQKVWTADADGKLTYVNKLWLDYTGMTSDEFQQSGYKSIIHPEDDDKTNRLWLEAMQDGKKLEVQHRFRCNDDGSYRWHLTTCQPQKDTNGKILAWICTTTDIEKQKSLAEEKFLLDFADDFASYDTGSKFFGSLVTYIADKTKMDYVFIGALSDECETESHNNHKHFTIKTIALAAQGEIVPNIEYPLPDGPCEQVIRGTVYSYPQHCRQLFPSNETLIQFNVEGYVGYPLFDSDGKPIGLVAVMHEKEIPNPEYVSALLKIIAKRAEYEMERNKLSEELSTSNQNLKASLGELQRSNEKLDHFAHVASHDLQEPARKILTFSGLLQKRYADELSPDANSYIEKIKSASTRMTLLISDVLSFARLSSQEQSFTDVDLNKTLDNVLNDYDLLITEKHAKVIVDNLPVLNAIQLQMNQLFNNLLNNALKFTKENVTPVITITTRMLTANEIKERHHLDQHRSYCEIIFKDNGIGFEQQFADQVFIMFQRLNGRSQYSGTGIGLSLCKKIVENHQGEIFVTAKEGEGAAFHIVLPVTEETKIVTAIKAVEAVTV